MSDDTMAERPLGPATSNRPDLTDPGVWAAEAVPVAAIAALLGVPARATAGPESLDTLDEGLLVRRYLVDFLLARRARAHLGTATFPKGFLRTLLAQGHTLAGTGLARTGRHDPWLAALLSRRGLDAVHLDDRSLCAALADVPLPRDFVGRVLVTADRVAELLADHPGTARAWEEGTALLVRALSEPRATLGGLLGGIDHPVMQGLSGDELDGAVARLA